MAGQNYLPVASGDNESNQPIPNSPPPSFRSHDSTPRSSQERARRERQTHSRNQSQSLSDPLADAFDADGSDSDEDNDGDDRQRLMRGTPTEGSSREPPSPVSPVDADAGGAIQLVDTRDTPRPVGERPVQGRVYGGGSGDGVWANLNAKPERGEKQVEEHPPTYEAAAADAAPPYWETTILTPGSYDPNEVYIDGLPVGSFFSFIWNATISMSFQLVGFLLTYLLHTTHAAKNGSRAGLGVTLIQYGFYLKGSAEESVPGNGEQVPSDPDRHDWNAKEGGFEQGGEGVEISGQEWMAYVLMVVGWFLLIRSVGEYLRARRHEQLVLQSPDRGLGVPVIAEGESSERVV